MAAACCFLLLALVWSGAGLTFLFNTCSFAWLFYSAFSSLQWHNIAGAECPSKLQGDYVRFARERQPSVGDIMAAKRAAGKLKRTAFGGLGRSASLRRRPSFAAKSVLGGGGGKKAF